MLKRFFAMVALALVMVICGTALVACGQQSNNSGSGTQQGETGGGGTGGGNGGGEEEPPVPTYDLFVNNVAGEQVTVKMYLNSLDSTAIFTETGEDDFQKTYSAIEIDKEDKVLAEVGTVAVIFTIENNSQDKDLGVYFWNKADEDATAPTEASISMVNGTEKSDILYGHHYYGEEDLFDLEYEFYNHIPAGETETMHIYVRVTALPDGELKFGMPIYLNIEEYVPTADYDATE